MTVMARPPGGRPAAAGTPAAVTHGGTGGDALYGFLNIPGGTTAQRKSILRFRTAAYTLEPMAEKKKRKDPAAVALGRRGGKKTAQNLTPEQRSKLARNAVRARWKKAKKEQAK